MHRYLSTVFKPNLLTDKLHLMHSVKKFITKYRRKFGSVNSDICVELARNCKRLSHTCEHSTK